MAENLYEGMFLLESNRFAANPEGMANAVVGILEKSGATVVANRPWLDGKLAYPIEGNRKGLHYLTYFRLESTRMPEITLACKLNDSILRHMVIKHPTVLFDAMVSALTGGDVVAETPPAPAAKVEVDDEKKADDEKKVDDVAADAAE